MADNSIPTPESPKPRELVFTKSDGFKRTYANQAIVLTTPYDIQVVFGEIIEATETEMKVLNHAHITMSPEHAKQLHELLGKKLADFEGEFRKITLPAPRE